MHTAAMWVRHRLLPQNDAAAASKVCISGKSIFPACKHLFIAPEKHELREQLIQTDPVVFMDG